MPIINNTSTIAKEVANQKDAITRLHRSVKSQFVQLGRSFWQNPSYTPVELAAEYGTDCGELFRLSSILAQMIYDATGEVINPIPEGFTHTINQDGIVTITPPAPEEPEDDDQQDQG